MKRKLKIEEKGIAFDHTRRVPMVRLKGRWLAAAGFPAGASVQITVYAPGRMDVELIPAPVL